MAYCIRKFNGAVEKGHKMIKTSKMKNFKAFLSDVAGINWEQMLNETDDINVLVNHWTNQGGLTYSLSSLTSMPHYVKCVSPKCTVLGLIET